MNSMGRRLWDELLCTENPSRTFKNLYGCKTIQSSMPRRLFK